VVKTPAKTPVKSPAKAPAKTTPTKVAAPKSTAAKASPSAAPVTKAAPAKATGSGSTEKKATTKATPAKAAKSTTAPTPAKSAPTAEGATMAKTAEPKTTEAKTATKAAVRRGTRTAAETQQIRDALDERLVDLRDEYDQTVTEIAEMQRDRLTDSAGDDQADTGTKTFEREQEISLANNILERITQVERAVERLEEGNYGWCERCGNAIPVERLAAFPSATLCVSCKQLEERR
jgi:RNA polymerase-binding transcription factor